jgi:predicted nucleotidyltransferase
MEREVVDRCTIFSTVVGSTAYGTNTPESDIDIRGVAIIDDPNLYFGYLDRFEQFEDKVNDVVVYDIRKAFRLISDANPNMLDLLFVDERFRRFVHPAWERVIDNRDKFLSKRVRYTYTGYAFAQLKRIKTARSWLLNPPKKKPERSDFGLPEKKVLSKSDIGAFQWVMSHLLRDTIEYLNLSDETKDELRDSNWIGLVQRKGVPDHCWDETQKISGASDEWMDAMKREQGYINAKRHFDSYTQWKYGRNKKRAELEEKFGYDTKHASHLVRLMRMGKEILSEGKVLVFRPDAEELKAIRNGAWTYDQIEEYANSMEQEIISLMGSSPLPKEPNRKFLNQLCVDIIKEYLNK